MNLVLLLLLAANRPTIVSGTVTFEGTPPPRQELRMNADPYCVEVHASPVMNDDVVVGGHGELANVIVYVKNAPASDAPPTTEIPLVIEMKGCMFAPRVAVAEVGQPVVFRNDDDTLHNVHGLPLENDAFNVGQPVRGMTWTRRFALPEFPPFRIKNDVHPWMSCHLAVLPHPFHAVTGTDGRFSIANLPPGRYTFVAWHERFGQQEQEVTIEANEQKAIAFRFHDAR